MQQCEKLGEGSAQSQVLRLEWMFMGLKFPTSEEGWHKKDLRCWKVRLSKGWQERLDNT